MEALKIILISVIIIAFFVIVAVLKINIKSKKSRTKTCSNPEVSDKSGNCGDCTLADLCNFKENK